MLKIHNTYTGNKEVFVPIEEGKVRMYVCGLTVYDYSHLGHARMLVAFDVIVRYLRSRGYTVTYVRNITDIDDKIIQRATDNEESFQELTKRIVQANREDEVSLGILPPDQEPRATDYISEIIAIIEILIEKDHAYLADNGDVYYRVSSFADYGKLSGKQIEELRAGARVEVQEAKHDPVDFALWKASKTGEPSWDSPWGPGRPGWHIECSAMSMAILGEHFDIHGGGQDLQFPHHENEIAQSCGATGKAFVNYWLHNGFLRIEDEKMSKSLGNFFTVKDVLSRYTPEVVRYFLLASHYRSPLNYSDTSLDEARAALAGLYTALRNVPAEHGSISQSHQEAFENVMDDDFNTPRAIAVLHDLGHAINRLPDREADESRMYGATLRHLGKVLGLLQEDPDTFLQAGVPGSGSGLSDEQINDLIHQRKAARDNRDFKRADEIREQLSAAGILLEDNPGGTTWRRS